MSRERNPGLAAKQWQRIVAELAVDGFTVYGHTEGFREDRLPSCVIWHWVLVLVYTPATVWYNLVLGWSKSNERNIRKLSGEAYSGIDRSDAESRGECP